MQKARYIGQNQLFQGCTTLIKNVDDLGWCEVQFDKCEAVPELQYGWHGWRLEDWEII